MQIRMKQAEILAGIRLQLAQMGLQTAGQNVTADFTNSRKDGGGLIADIRIGEDDDVPTANLPKVGAGPHAAQNADLQNAEANAAKQGETDHVVGADPAPETAPVEAKPATGSLFGS